jgi:peptidoglycan/xylan/chitin deacetylase (PgdA/CDA1 family)
MSSQRVSAFAWFPSVFMKLTFAVHGLIAVMIVVRWHLWPLALGCFVVNHLLITAAGLSPRASLLGPVITRLPATACDKGLVAITIDDGPDPDVTPKVLDILDRFRARATFFCVGDRVLACPDLSREIVRRGHTIENHSLHHWYLFSLLGPWSMTREVRGGQEAINAVVGRRPSCFRAPAGFRNPFLQPILGRLGLTLVSWTRRGFDTVERNPDKVSQRLLRGLSAGDILLLHDGRAARTAEGAPVILVVLPRLLEAIEKAGLRTTTLEI